MRGVSIFGGVIRLSIEDSKLRAQDHVEGVARNGAIHDVVKCFQNDPPVLVLNQSVTVAEVDGPATGLAIVRQVADAPTLQGYYLCCPQMLRETSLRRRSCPRPFECGLIPASGRLEKNLEKVAMRPI